MSSFHATPVYGLLLLVIVLGSSSMARGREGDVAEGLDCKFRCPRSLRPSPRAQYKSSSNGCGTEAFRLPASALPHPDFEACCNEHDLCYDTCLADKGQCDAAFDACMQRVCDTKVVTGKDSCVSTANLFMSLTKNLGCDPFINSQKQACVCKSDDEL
ncbi:group XIIA secretory phospholipase A2-like [Dermacentor andersoni]|uniref:group XIIA secretory phospholipase A2-like n=1 Tax=Dermacentor andersoni TaxID=34620 RepID=UPI002155C209|nr:group XIIA secretory phospholipase A2-like [Dermacentor andersoni]